MTLYWLSFASEHGFLGAVIVEARDEKKALREVSRRKLNPGGQAWIVKVPPDNIDQARPYRNRLLYRPELERIFGPNSTHEQRCELDAAVVCDGCNDVTV